MLKYVKLSFSEIFIYLWLKIIYKTDEILSVYRLNKSRFIFKVAIDSSDYLAYVT